ncbi:MAG: ferric reductase-like transmembrane domain-containing protein [Candidatus Peregrinibacteria bacterium]
MTLQRLARNNWLWLVLTLISGGFLLLIKDSQDPSPVSASAGIGTFFLILTLIPDNLRKLPIRFLEKTRITIGRLVKYRRDLGIVTGFVFVFHVLFVILSRYPMINWNAMLFNANVPGTVGAVLMVLILLTSNAWGFRILKSQWKIVQSLVWFIVPLGFVHGMLIKWKVEQEPSAIALIGFGGIVAFVVLEYALNVLQGQRSASAKRHLILVFLGTVAAGAIVWFVP